MKNSTRIGLVLALLAALLAATSSSSAAAETSDRVNLSPQTAVEERPYDPLPEVAAPKVGDPISAAEMQDLRAVANEFDISLEEAIAKYSWVDNFSLALDTLREQGVGFAAGEADGIRSAWIGFKDDTPDSLAPLLEQLRQVAPGIRVDVRANLGYDERDMEEALEAAHFAVYNSPSVHQVNSFFSHDDRSIRIDVSLDKGTDERQASLELSQLARAAVQHVAEAPAVFQTKLTFVEAGEPLSVETNDSYHIGGERLTSPGGSLVCTAGFNIRLTSSTSGDRGMATAGHCLQNNSPTRDDGSVLTEQDWHNGTHGDFGWLSGTQFAGGSWRNDNFYAGLVDTHETNLRDTAAVGDMAVGGTLCRNGARTLLHCSDVRKTSVCSNSNCNLVQMGTGTSEGGDSGAPWYWSNTAYGYHEGFQYDPAWPAKRDVFSKATRIDNALGVYVATS